MATGVRRATWLVTLALVLGVAAGCGIQGQDCPSALLEGELTTSTDADLVVTGPDATQGARVIWEPDHVVREIDGELVLVDRAGAIVAREGDRISLGGGFTTGNAFRPCGEITVRPAR